MEVEYVRTERKRVQIEVGTGISESAAASWDVGTFSRGLNYHLQEGKSLTAGEKPRLLSWRLIEAPTCGRDLGSRPSWMSPDQYDPCPCVLPEGHDGDCACSCKATDDASSQTAAKPEQGPS